jgi:uncharacterized protein YbaP (TraB family)
VPRDGARAVDEASASRRFGRDDDLATPSGSRVARHHRALGTPVADAAAPAPTHETLAAKTSIDLDMIKRLFAMALLVVSASAMAAPSGVPAQTLLWTVASKSRTLYLTGDTQVLLPSDYPLPARVVKAFNDSGELVLEGDPGVDSTHVSALIRQTGVLPASERLTGILDPRDARLVQQVAEQLGVPLEKVDPLRPWLAALVLSNAANAKLGCVPARQETNHFYALARSRRLPITPLETADTQLGLFAKMPEDLQIAWLTVTARRWMDAGGHREAERARIVRAWRSGDIDVLAKVLLRQFDQHPGLYAALVAQRNDAWLSTLEAKLEQPGPPVFVLVGAGHLVGSDNLVSLLTKAGYRVAR